MLFSVKNKLSLTFALTFIFTSVSILLKELLHIGWNLDLTGETVRYFIYGLGFILATDIIIGFALVLLFHRGYVRIWMEMAGFFSSQRWYVIPAGGLLAASEEIFFRGVLIPSMILTLGIEAEYAVLISAALFGLFHVIRKKSLALFSLWAFWEGLVLGGIYVYTESLPAVMAVHAAHDIIKFTLFSFQRERGFLLMKRHLGF
jgi:membrane protease YdiL (CAAX protease family)